MVETKKWYQSKIVLFGIALALVYGSNFLTGWLGGNVSADQLDAIVDTKPQVLDIVNRLKNGESVLSLLGAIAGVLISVLRVWFTSNLIPQSLKKELPSG